MGIHHTDLELVHLVVRQGRGAIDKDLGPQVWGDTEVLVPEELVDRLIRRRRLVLRLGSVCMPGVKPF